MKEVDLSSFRFVIELPAADSDSYRGFQQSCATVIEAMETLNEEDSVFFHFDPAGILYFQVMIETAVEDSAEYFLLPIEDIGGVFVILAACGLFEYSDEALMHRMVPADITLNGVRRAVLAYIETMDDSGCYHPEDICVCADLSSITLSELGRIDDIDSEFEARNAARARRRKAPSQH